MTSAGPSAAAGLTLAGKEFRIDPGMARMLRLYNEFVDEVTDPQALVEEARRQPLAADVLTFLQLPPETAPKFHFPMEWEHLAVVDVSTYEHWLKHQVHENTRKKIRKAERSGVTVRLESFSDQLAAGLVELFNETPIRQGRRFAYYGWDVEMVKRAWGTELERSLWLVAYYNDELIGFIKLVLGGQIARASGTLAKLAHRDKGTMNALLAKAVQVSAEKGIPLLSYGRFVYGKKGEDSLTAFKKRSGFRRLSVPRYFVPISRRGELVLRLGLHRGVKGLLPGSVVRALLKLRSKVHPKAAGH
jgi:hypothetical protein